MKKQTLIRWLGRSLLVVLVIAGLFATTGFAQPMPKITVGIDKAQKPQDVAVTIEILFLLTILTLAPAFMILVTSFTRIIVIFHFLRQALGLQQMPPNQVLIGLALFLTFFVMNPVLRQINDDALQPYTKEQISYDEAFKKGVEPLRTFMMKQTREKDLALFVSLSRGSKPQNASEIPTHVLIPAFVVSELRIAFQIGFLLYIPFLVIDVIVASVLMSMGMLMLPPVMISLPFKILLFVLVDGWYLVVGSIVRSFA